MGGDSVDESLAAFCEQQRHDLVGLLFVTLGDRAIADELAQETLVRVCQHWSKVSQLDRPDAWMRRVALNLSASWFRRRAAEWRANGRHGPSETDRTEPTADHLAVREAVAALPRRQRQVLALRYFVGLNVTQTAQEMGCAQGTVKSLTSRAMAAMREQFTDLQEDHHGRP